jgi:hypothetical protein
MGDRVQYQELSLNFTKVLSEIGQMALFEPKKWAALGPPIS